MNKRNVIIALVFIVQISWAQDSLFFKQIGDPYGSEEIEAVIQLTDNSLVSAGFSDAFSADGDGDAFIIKTDINGNVQWAKAIGDTSDNMAIDIKQTPDGGLIFAGWTKYQGGDYDFWVVKLTATGNMEWEKRFGGQGNDQAWSVDITPSGYVVTGGTTSYGAGMSDIWVIALDNNGNIVWQKTYGSAGEDAPPGNYEEYVARGFVDNNNRLVIAGLSDGVGHGGMDIIIAQIDVNTGNILWQNAYGNANDESLWNHTLAFNGDAYYLPGNITLPGNTDGDLWLVKIDTTGTIIWQKTFGITGKWDEALNASSAHNGILIASYYETNANDWSGTALKINENGVFQWGKKFQIGNLDWTNDIKELADYSIIMAGVTTNTTTWNEDYLYLKADANGEISTCNLITTFNPVEDTTNTTEQAINLTVTTTSATGLPVSSSVTDVSLNKTTGCSAAYQPVNSKDIKNHLVSIYPNPAVDVLYLANIPQNAMIQITDLSGRIIEQTVVKQSSFQLSTQHLPRGAYLLVVSSENRKMIRKIMVQ